MFSQQSSQHCQSKYYKEWHPDYISSYSSLGDRHLKHFFKHPARQTHLNRNNQITPSGREISEKEWRRQNLAWERRRRDDEERAERVHQRDVDERRDRMVLRQQQKDKDSRRRRDEREQQKQQMEDQDPMKEVKEAWIDQASLLSKISNTKRSDVEHLLNFLNFEIEYILRPKSAPIRYRPPTASSSSRPRSHSARRGRPPRPSSSRFCRNRPSPGYPSVSAGSRSLERGSLVPDDQERVLIRNIEVPDSNFPSDRNSAVAGAVASSASSYGLQRPSTAPAAPARAPPGRRRRPSRPRSPSHARYKEDAYLTSTVSLQYAGHPDHSTRLESRARHRKHRKSKRLPPVPHHLDEVTIVQQPRGSYVLEVYHGFLAVGDNFSFTSRRVDGYPFSLTLYVNRQCHVRLSTCCESKRTIGCRLGQGFFQLIQVEGALPCIRCLLEKDPVAQKHAARIQKLRGSYDRYGNRRPPSFQKKTRRRKRGQAKDEGETLESDYENDFDLLDSDPRPPYRDSDDKDSSYHHRSPRRHGPGSGLNGVSTSSGGARLAHAPKGRRRPKSAPKHKSLRAEEAGSPVPELDEYSSVDGESSEEDIPLPHDEDDEDDEEEEEASSSISSYSGSEDSEAEAAEDEPGGYCGRRRRGQPRQPRQPRQQQQQQQQKTKTTAAKVR